MTELPKGICRFVVAYSPGGQMRFICRAAEALSGPIDRKKPSRYGKGSETGFTRCYL